MNVARNDSRQTVRQLTFQRKCASFFSFDRWCTLSAPNMAPSKPNGERRSGTRIPTRVPTRLKTSDGQEISAQTRDVSANGVFLYTSSRMQQGSEVELVLILSRADLRGKVLGMLSSDDCPSGRVGRQVRCGAFGGEPDQREAAHLSAVPESALHVRRHGSAALLRLQGEDVGRETRGRDLQGCRPRWDRI